MFHTKSCSMSNHPVWTNALLLLIVVGGATVAVQSCVHDDGAISTPSEWYDRQGVVAVEVAVVARGLLQALLKDESLAAVDLLRTPVTAVCLKANILLSLASCLLVFLFD